MTLSEFLLARISEDERAADRARHDDPVTGRRPAPEPSRGAGTHLDLRDPERMLAECRAKRRVVILAYEATGLDQTVDMERETGARRASGVHYVGDRILRALASVYVGHPDFDPAWTD